MLRSDIHNTLPVTNRFAELLLAKGMYTQQAQGVHLVRVKLTGLFNKVADLIAHFPLTRKKSSLRGQPPGIGAIFGRAPIQRGQAAVSINRLLVLLYAHIGAAQHRPALGVIRLGLQTFPQLGRQIIHSPGPISVAVRRL